MRRRRSVLTQFFWTAVRAAIQPSNGARGTGSTAVLWMAVLALGAVCSTSAQTAYVGQPLGGGFSSPWGVAVDSTGNVYVANQGNSLVTEIPVGCTSAEFDADSCPGENLTTGLTSLGGGFSHLGGVAVDEKGNVYVTDGNAVKEIPVGCKSSEYDNGDCSVTTLGGGFSGPQGVAVDGNGNIYVADTGNNAVKEISAGCASASCVTTLGGGLSDPVGVAVDSLGNVYVADSGANPAVEEIPTGCTSASCVTTLGGGFSTNVVGVAVDSLGNVYVADNSYAVKEMPAGCTSSSCVTTLVGDFHYPDSVAVDGNGNVYWANDQSDSSDGGGYKVKEIVRHGANAGSVAVKAATPATLTVTFTFVTGGEITAPAVLTQGAAGLDFTDAGTGTCDTNGTSYSYNEGDSCTVNVIFNPKFAGTRYGAVVLSNSSSVPIATAYIYGAGTGPQVAFSPSAITTLGGGFNAPYGVAVDGSGNVYVADNGNNAVKQMPAGCTSSTCLTTLGGGFSGAYGVAVDGGGNIYVSYGSNGISKMPPGCASSSCVTTLGGGGFNGPGGLAVDGSGNVYVPDAVYEVSEMPPGCASSSCITVLGGGFDSPTGVAVDGSGNVYVADTLNNAVKEMPAGCTSSSCVSTLGGGFNEPYDVAVDGGGNVFVADTYNSAVKEIPAGCVSSACVTTLGDGFNYSIGVAVDGSGNVYVADTGNNSVKEVARATPSSLTFAITPAGQTSSDSPQTVALSNDGNAPLSFPIPNTGNNPSITANFALNSGGASACPLVASGSSTPGTLAAGATCLLPISFAPTVAGVLNGSLVLTDNNLNGSNASQAIQLSGIATANPAATPTFSPAAGTYSSAQTVTISDSTTGATIYYTTDGTTPTTNSTVYNGAITVLSTETIEAVATASGYSTSSVASATYTINLPQAATPAFNLPSGTYNGASVAITDVTPNTTIYYTTNGTTPTDSSTVYDAPIPITSSETIEAIAMASSYTPSAVASASYTIDSALAATGEWAWKGGSSTVPAVGATPGIYGTLGQFATGNVPGARWEPAGWTGQNGKFWLFGGNGTDSAGNEADLNDLWEFDPKLGTNGEWAWMGGTSTLSCNSQSGCQNPAGVYGTIGQFAAANIPGGRYGSVTWVDKTGRLWLFGGDDANDIEDFRNDLWVFDPAQGSHGEWAWMGGTSTPATCQHSGGSEYCGGSSGVYGTLGQFASANVPGGRSHAVSWKDSSGNFWLFGGLGVDAAGNQGYLNDLWEFNPSLGAHGEWAWMGGSSTLPSTCGASSSGCNQPGVYGTLGQFASANVPAARAWAVSWIDNNGNTWLFGGVRNDTNGLNDLNDLWEFNPSLGTNGEWAWMGGDTGLSPCQSGQDCGWPGIYGTLGQFSIANQPGSRESTAAWTDNVGRLWLFGGLTYDSAGIEGQLNDLWVFDPSVGTNGEWAWMGGSSHQLVSDCSTCYVKPPGIFGPLGQFAAGNTPGSRELAIGWTGGDGNFWLFGGIGTDSVGTDAVLNDLWEYESPEGAVRLAAPAFSPAGGTYASAQSVTISDATSGATIYYTTDGSTPTTSSTKYTGAVTVSTSETIQAIATATGYSNSSVATATYTINLPAAAAPTFSPAAGTYSSIQTVTISDSTTGATVYYTTNGTTPTTSSPVYIGPITVSSTETIEAIATASGYVDSPVATANYTINPALQSGPLGIVATGFSEIRGLAADASGNVYVADDGGGNSSDVGTYKETLANGSYSQTNLSNMQAYGVAVDGSGNVYFAGDNGVSVYKLTVSDGTYAQSKIATGFSEIRGLAADASGNVYVADDGGGNSSDVGTYKETLANGSYSQTNLSSMQAYGVAVDGSGNVYFAGDNGVSVYKLTVSDGTYAQSKIATGFSEIRGLAADASGNVYVADDGGGNSSDVGTYKETLANGSYSQANLSNMQAYGVAVDGSGNVYFAGDNGVSVYIVKAVAAPTFSPSAGTYTSAQTVTLSDATSGATIYYTTDGTTPTTSSTKYTAAITVSSTETLKAIAVASGYTNSAVASATYTINIPVTATPTFSPAAGTYTSAQTVTISDATAGAAIYYTTDGTAPTTASTKYVGAISVSSTETIEAMAAASGYTNSAVATAAYTINIPNNPIPVLSSLSPAFTNSGGSAFTLTANGSGFVSGSTVRWGSTSLTTTYVSATQLTAQVPASAIASSGTFAITVQTPSPGGGASNTLDFEVDSGSSGTGPTFTTLTATVTPGSTATYPVTLPSSASGVTATCLNMPGGASCSYSASSGAVIITTSSSTPAGTYQITVVFTETLPGAASGLIFLPILLLPLAWARRRWKLNGMWLIACLILVLAITAGLDNGCGGGGGGGGGGSTPTTHTVTSSGTVTLTVQ